MGNAGGVTPIVVVNGCPGSGKTTLARELAPILRLPLLAKDTIKEAMWDAMPIPAGLDPGTWSQHLGAASYEVLWGLLREAAGSVVVEAPLMPELTISRLRALERPVIEVFLHVSAEAIAERDASRWEERHEAHQVRGGISLASAQRVVDVYAPLRIGPLLELDGERGVDARDAASWVRDRLSERGYSSAGSTQLSAPPPPPAGASRG